MPGFVQILEPGTAVECFQSLPKLQKMVPEQIISAGWCNVWLSVIEGFYMGQTDLSESMWWVKAPKCRLPYSTWTNFPKRELQERSWVQIALLRVGSTQQKALNHRQMFPIELPLDKTSYCRGKIFHQALYRSLLNKYFCKIKRKISVFLVFHFLQFCKFRHLYFIPLLTSLKRLGILIRIRFWYMHLACDRTSAMCLDKF